MIYRDLEDHRADSKKRQATNLLPDVPEGICFLRDLGLPHSKINNVENVKLFVIKK